MKDYKLIWLVMLVTLVGLAGVWGASYFDVNITAGSTLVGSVNISITNASTSNATLNATLYIKQTNNSVWTNAVSALNATANFTQNTTLRIVTTNYNDGTYDFNFTGYTAAAGTGQSTGNFTLLTNVVIDNNVISASGFDPANAATVENQSFSLHFNTSEYANSATAKLGGNSYTCTADSTANMKWTCVFSNGVPEGAYTYVITATETGTGGSTQVLNGNLIVDLGEGHLTQQQRQTIQEITNPKDNGSTLIIIAGIVLLGYALLKKK